MRLTLENLLPFSTFHNPLTPEQQNAFDAIKEYFIKHIGGPRIDARVQSEVENLDRLQCRLLVAHFEQGLRGDSLRLISAALGKRKEDKDKITDDDVSKLLWLKNELFNLSWTDVCGLFSAAAPALRDARRNTCVTENDFMLMVCRHAQDRSDLFHLFFYANSSMLSAISDNIILDEGLLRKIIENKYTDEAILLKIIPKFKVEILFDDIPDHKKTNSVLMAIENRLSFIKIKEELDFFLYSMLRESRRQFGNAFFQMSNEMIARAHFYNLILSVDSEKELFFTMSRELLRLKDTVSEEIKAYRRKLIEIFKENLLPYDFLEVKIRLISAVKSALDYTVIISNDFMASISDIESNDILSGKKDDLPYSLDDASSEEYFFHYFQNLILCNDNNNFPVILSELNCVLENHTEFSDEIRSRLFKMKEIMESFPDKSVLLQQLLNTDIVIIFDLIHSADSLEMLYEILKNESYDFINSSPAVEKILDEIYGYYLIERELRKAEISFEL